MRTSTIQQIVTLFLGVLSLAGVGIASQGPKTCQGQPLNLERKAAAHAACREELKDVLQVEPGLSRKERKEIFMKSCFGACVMEKIGLVADDAGNSEGVKKFVEFTYPEAFRAAAMDGTNACLASKGTDLSKAEDCKSYRDLFECLRTAQRTVCGDEKENDEEDDTDPAPPSS